MASSTPPASATSAQGRAAALLEAFETGRPIAPLTAATPDLSVADAYGIQRALLAGHAAAGRSAVGRKIGLTSRAMQEQLGVDSPDFGILLRPLVVDSGATLSRGALHVILPRLEAEIGFVLGEDLAGPGVTARDVMAATATVVPVFELIDSRITDWKITLADTIADNASGLGAVLGHPVSLADAGSLPELEMTMTRDGEVVGRGRGDAVLGDPAEAVAWLANAVAEFGEVLTAGEPILSGALHAAVDATPGRYEAEFGPAFGSVSVTVED